MHTVLHSNHHHQQMLSGNTPTTTTFFPHFLFSPSLSYNDQQMGKNVAGYMALSILPVLNWVYFSAGEVVKVKVICALILMAKEGSLKKIFKQWTLVGTLTASGLPADIYALQNSLLQISYKNLDSLTFSMLKQTKLFFSALFTYIILRQKQSIQQIGALFLLIIAVVLLSIGEGSSSSNPDEILFHGIVTILIASVLSGLASALCQWASQVKKHTSYMLTVEMSIVGIFCLLVSTYKSQDGEAIRRQGFFYGWTPLTLGFAIVSALPVTALLQFIVDGKPPSLFCLVSLPLVITSISIYQKYPYRVRKKES